MKSHERFKDLTWYVIPAEGPAYYATPQDALNSGEKTVYSSHTNADQWPSLNLAELHGTAGITNQ